MSNQPLIPPPTAVQRADPRATLAFRGEMLEAIRDDFRRISDLFWAKVQRPEDPNNYVLPCWPWNLNTQGRSMSRDFSFRLKHWDSPTRWHPARFAFFAITDKDLLYKISMRCEDRHKYDGVKCANPNHIRNRQTLDL